MVFIRSNQLTPRSAIFCRLWQCLNIRFGSMRRPSFGSVLNEIFFNPLNALDPSACCIKLLGMELACSITVKMIDTGQHIDLNPTVDITVLTIQTMFYAKLHCLHDTLFMTNYSICRCIKVKSNNHSQWLCQTSRSGGITGGERSTGGHTKMKDGTSLEAS